MNPQGLLSKVGVPKFQSQNQPVFLTVHDFKSIKNNKVEMLATSELYIMFLLAFDDRTLRGNRLQLLSHLLVMLT